MKKVLFILLIAVMCACTQEQKAQRAVKQFITTYATYPESYDPISFGEFEPFVNENGMKLYRITTMYRIQNSAGKMEVFTKKYEMSERFNVIAAPFERVDE